MVLSANLAPITGLMSFLWGKNYSPQLQVSLTADT